MIELFNSYLLKYDIDYASYLIIYDLYYKTDYFKNYFLQNQHKIARSNIDRGTLTNVFFLISAGLVENSLSDIDNEDKHNTETIDIYYKRLKLTDKAKEIVKNINTANTEKVINPISKSEQINDWIDEYRYKWVKNNKMLKNSAMGNKQTCITKMADFVKEFPQYSKEIILQATDRYINDYMTQYRSDFTYLITAPYFIKRERTPDGKLLTNIPMRLEDYCELIINETKDTNSNIPVIHENDLA